MKKDLAQKYRVNSIYPRSIGYLFCFLTIISTIYLIYHIFIFHDNLLEQIYEWIVVILISIPSIYLFLGYPKEIEINEEYFTPFKRKTAIEFFFFSKNEVLYEEISHVNIFRIDGYIFRIDIILKNGKKIHMHYLERNPKVAKIYEDVFKNKLDRNNITFIDKYSEESL